MREQEKTADPRADHFERARWETPMFWSIAGFAMLAVGAVLLLLLLVIAPTCSPQEDKLPTAQSSAGSAIRNNPAAGGGYATEQELEAAKKAVEQGPMPGPPVVQQGTPTAPQPGSGTESTVSAPPSAPSPLK